MFSGPAADDAALQANAIGLAFSLALAANPGGRISDADVRYQMDRVKLNRSSKTQIAAGLTEVKREIMVNMANHLRYKGYTQNKEGKAYYDKLMLKIEKMDNLAEEESAGLKAGDVESGYRFNGGDPGDPNNWTRK